MQNHRCLKHFHHKSGFTPGYVVGRAHAGENLVEPADFRLFRRHERPRLREQDDESRLTQERGLSRHIRSGEYDYLLTLGVEMHIVGDIFLAGGHHRLDDRMPSPDDVEFHPPVHLRAAVAPFEGKLRESGEDIEPGDDSAIEPDSDDVRADFFDRFVIYL